MGPELVEPEEPVLDVLLVLVLVLVLVLPVEPFVDALELVPVLDELALDELVLDVESELVLPVEPTLDVLAPVEPPSLVLEEFVLVVVELLELLVEVLDVEVLDVLLEAEVEVELLELLDDDVEALEVELLPDEVLAELDAVVFVELVLPELEEPPLEPLHPAAAMAANNNAQRTKCRVCFKIPSRGEMRW